MYLSVGRYKNFLLCTFLVLSLQYSAYSQIEGNNWFFGKFGGTNFSTGYPEVLISGEMEAPAGCSSISDKNGNLLFYTNGQVVWNKNHEVMTGGTDLNGEIGNTQSCIIVQKPNDESVYYIFTTRQNSMPPSKNAGIYYSEVNFNSANPLGIVVNKDYLVNSCRTNQITAVHAPDGNNIRVIAFGTQFDTDNSLKNSFFIINVTELGVETNFAVKIQSQNLISSAGIKVSPDGTTMAIVDTNDHNVHIYNFDNQTLDVTFNQTINCDIGFTPFIPYGVEFSQNSKLLYCSASGNYIIQIDFHNPGEFNRKIYIESGSSKLGSLQMARDGKIYVSQYKNLDPGLPYGYLGVINRPDKIGLDCDYDDTGLQMNGSAQFGSLSGLPNYVASIFRNRIITDDHCVSEPFNFELDSYAPITAVTWDFGDGNTSTSFNPSHQYAVGKDYLVKATIIIKNNPITLFKHITVYPVPDLTANQTMKQCDLDSDGVSIFNLNNIKNYVSNHADGFKYTFYKNQQDATDEVNEIGNPDAYENISNPQQIFVNIVSEHGCFVTSSFYIHASYTQLNSIKTLYACENSDGVSDNAKATFNLSAKANEIKAQFNLPQSSVISFYQNSQDALTLTNSLGYSPTLSSGEIWVRVDNQDLSCNGIGTMSLEVNPTMYLDIKDRYEFCGDGGSVVLDGGSSNEYWEWKNNAGTILSTERFYTITEAERYTVTAYKTVNGLRCDLTKAFYVVAPVYSPAFDIVKADSDKIYVSIKGNGDFEFSLDGTRYYGEGTEFTFRDVPAGIYTIHVKDKANCGLFLTKKVALIGYPKYFSPNNDGSNEIWKLHGISKQLYSEATIHIYDRFGNFLFYMNIDGNQSGWDGKYNGKSLPASDYWYTSVVIDRDNNIYTKKGHFSLVR